MRGVISMSGNRGGRVLRRAAATAAVASALGVFGAAAPAVAHWESATPVDSAGGGFGATTLDTALSASPDGLATALFIQPAPAGPAAGSPHAIRRALGASAWSAPVAVATPAGSVDGFARPGLASGSNGDALGVFHFRDPTPRRVTHATSWPADAAAPDAAVPALCATGSECGVDPPQVAIDGAGNGYAAATSSTSVVFARRNGATGAWSPTEVVAAGSAPQIAVNAGGDLVIVYSRLDTSNPALQVRRIYAKRRLAGEVSFGPERQVSGPNTTDSAGHAVVIDGAGRATIAFPEDTLPPGGGPTPAAPVIMASAWARANAAPDAAVPISAQGDGQARFAVAAVDTQGRVTAAWQAFSGHFVVFSAELTGAGWSAPQHVSPEGSDRNASNPQVDVDPAGIATVAYIDNASPQGGDTDVKVSRRASGGDWSTPESLRSAGSGAGAVQGGHRVAAGRAGQADVTFVQQLNGVNRLFATRFNHVGYVRPRAAGPVKVPLVPAFRPCTSPDETHGPPLAFPSCSGPVQRSTTVTVGTPDANGHPAGSVGSVRLRVVPGDTGTTTNEADVLMSVSVTDVRRSVDRSDYAGELEAVVDARITDREPAPTEFEPSTVEDFGFGGPVSCAGTPDTIGATCATETSFNAIVPGAVTEGRRAVWQLGQVTLYDGGADGDIGTAPNAVFAVQGVFVP